MRTFLKKDPRTLSEPGPALHPVLPAFERAARATRHTSSPSTAKSPKATRKASAKPS